MPAIAAEVDDPSRAWWGRLPEVSAPMLLIGGGPTRHIPQELLAEVARAVPDGTLLTIPVGHQVHEEAPQPFANAVLGWTAGVGGTRLRPGRPEEAAALSELARRSNAFWGVRAGFPGPVPRGPHGPAGGV